MNLNVIIPNYNGRRFLSACLGSLRAQTYKRFSVTVVDNGSDDDSLLLLASSYPEVNVIKLPYNSGFSAAVNKGILRAGSPFVMLLNNDAILKPDCIERLMNAIAASPDIFSAGANILGMGTPRCTDTAGDYYSVFGYAFCRGQGLPPLKRMPGQVFSNCGCAVVYRAALLRKTGLFDQRFFAYLEDVDLGFRARRLGLRNVFCPDAVALHYGSGTTGRRYSPFKVYHSARNNILLRKKDLTAVQRMLHAPFFLAGTLLKYCYFRRIHLQKYYIRGLLNGLRECGPLPGEQKGGVRAFFRTEPWILYGTFLYIGQLLQRRLWQRTIFSRQNHACPAQDSDYNSDPRS